MYTFPGAMNIPALPLVHSGHVISVLASHWSVVARWNVLLHSSRRLQGSLPGIMLKQVQEK